jgi:hypothetical protein
MSKRGGSFFEVYIEAHVEKIIFGVAGIVCVWLLITRVLLSPNYVEYNGKKLGTGNIDKQISKDAELLRGKLGLEPKSAQQYEAEANNFIAQIESPFKNIGEGIYFPQPGNRPAIEISDGRKYSLPTVGNVNEISTRYTKAVVYIPTQNVDEENTYDKVGHEPNDLDFVTVEAKFNIATLYANFQKSFNGTDVPEEWRDPCLANPVFAAVQLERQKLGTDGSWSSWEVVPRTRIDPYRKMFEVIEDADRLPAGGIKVRLLQFDNPQIRMDMLQPEAYQIASAEEQWYPPSLHKEFMKYQTAVKAQEKRGELETKRQEREKQLEERRKQMPTSRQRITTTSGSEETDGKQRPTGVGGSGRTQVVKPTQTRPSDRKSEMEDKRPQRKKEAGESIPSQNIDEELSSILLTDKTDIGKMQGALVFWAHDDTVEAGKIYRYRLRLGVFNPIAGLGRAAEQDEQQKGKVVVLWSEFSEPSELVEISPRLCFFAQEIQEATKTVTVTVSRHVLGYWYSEKFMVKAGETIGNVVKVKPTETKEQLTIPEQVDYSVGAVMVDVTQVSDWSGGTNPYKRQYYDMLYSFDGTSVERMAIEQKYWPEKLQVMYAAIKKSEKEPKQPLRAFGSQVTERGRSLTPGKVGTGEIEE